jgi:glyoxylate reductase
LDVWSATEQIPRGELLARARGVDGILCMLTEQIDAQLIAACPSLLAVSSMSVGVDHVDCGALTRRGIPLGHTPGVLVETTADLVFALLLAVARRVSEADAYVRAGNWRDDNRWSPDMLLGRDVHGATLGIVGLGEIGQAVARRAAGFGMRVIGWTRSGRTVPGVASVGFNELLASSDFVSINVALAAQTRLLLDAAAIARIKPGAVLINCARGGIVDEVAMVRALRSGQLFAAGLDVFAREPLAPDDALLTLPNVVLTPHIGSATAQTREQMAAMAVANMVAALRGEVMPHCANPEVYAAEG